MLFGLQIGTERQSENKWDSVHATAKVCEEIGLDSLWYADHFMFGTPEDEVQVMECFTTLGALAATTQRVKLGAYVAGAPYRNPGLTAKMFSTLDVISHGRSIIGLGAAWHEPEFLAYGYRFPPVRERMEMLDEAVRIVLQMLTESPTSFDGKHYSIKDALNYPLPVQKPRPPLMIGGSGEKQTLRLVARYADMCNFYQGDPETTRRKYEVLREHCERLGRPYEEVLRTKHLTILLAADEAELARKKERHTRFNSDPPVVGVPDTVIARLQEYVDAGVQYFIFNMADAPSAEALYLFAEKVMPAFAEG